MSKTSPKRDAEIIALRAAGFSLAGVAAQTGSSVSTVQRVLKKRPTVKGEAFLELVENAQADYMRQFATSEGLSSIYTEMIADTTAQVRLARAKAAVFVELLEASDAHSAAKALRALAAHGTALKAQNDAIRALLPSIDADEGELPEICVVEMTAEEVKILRDQQEQELALIEGRLCQKEYDEVA